MSINFKNISFLQRSKNLISRFTVGPVVKNVFACRPKKLSYPWVFLYRNELLDRSKCPSCEVGGKNKAVSLFYIQTRDNFHFNRESHRPILRRGVGMLSYRPDCIKPEPTPLIMEDPSQRLCERYAPLIPYYILLVFTTTEAI